MTGRVLVVLGTEPDAPLCLAERIHQIVDLYRRADLAVALVLCTQGPAARRDLERLDTVCETVSLIDLSLPDDTDTETVDAALFMAMNDLVHVAPVDLIHTDRRIDPVFQSIGPLVCDCSGTAAIVVEGDLAPALCLAATEAERTALSDSGHAAVRLPPRMVPAPLAGLGGTTVGWPGRTGTGMADGWASLLQRLASQMPHRERQAILGPLPLEPEETPTILRSFVASPDTASTARRLATVGLAVAAGASDAEPFGTATDMIAMGRPVLLTAQSATMFEDRWHLPVSESSEAMADLVCQWIDDPDGGGIREAALSTRDSFARDLMVMEPYVAEQIRALLG